ncbi:MAG: CapA family protein [Defluviitaleaceae bacterium]|nr:CapA family protein [Defluviitaleaceae bacterium]
MKKIVMLFMLFILFFVMSIKVSAHEDLVIVRISAVGDCTFGRDERNGYGNSFDHVYDLHGPDHFFADVKNIFAEDDITIANLEGALTHETEHIDWPHVFKGIPEYANIFSLGNIDAVSLANNHSLDYGEQGFADTAAALEKYGVGWFGYGKAYIKNIRGVKVGLLGYRDSMPGLRSAVADEIKELRELGAQLIIISFHWGYERENYPHDSQQRLGRYAVDCGADLVLGHHPHVIQGIEKYKGKYIVYSLGNFSFGGNRNPEDKDTFIFRQAFVFKDGVLQFENPIEIIPCSVSSVQHRNDFRPVPLSGYDAARVIKRLNEYSEPFGDAEYKSNAALPKQKPPTAISYNGRLIDFEQPPKRENGLTMADAKIIASTLGLQSEWNETEMKITLRGVKHKTNIEMIMLADSKYYTVNGNVLAFPDHSRPYIKNGGVYVPAEYVANVFGFRSQWIEVKNLFYIRSLF